MSSIEAIVANGDDAVSIETDGEDVAPGFQSVCE